MPRTGDTPNLRQVHLIHAELFDELRTRGFTVSAGQMGENVTTSGIDLLGLPTGARLHLGGEAVVEVTGLRNPCRQLDSLQPGLMAATLDRDVDGNLVRKAGIMAIAVPAGSRPRATRSGSSCRPAAPPARASLKQGLLFNLRNIPALAITARAVFIQNV